MIARRYCYKNFNRANRRINKISIFFSNEQDYYKNYYKIFHNPFFSSDCCSSIHASATQLNNTQHMHDTVIIITFNYDQADRDRQCIVFCFPLREMLRCCSKHVQFSVQTVQVANYIRKEYYNFISFSRILLIQFRGCICKYLYNITGRNMLLQQFLKKHKYFQD